MCTNNNHQSNAKKTKVVQINVGVTEAVNSKQAGLELDRGSSPGSTFNNCVTSNRSLESS